LLANGSLAGPLKNAQFSGTLEHRDGDRPPSHLTGAVRLDTRGQVLGIYTDVTADSLSFDGLKGSFPTLPLRGAASGPVRLAGPLDALETHAELHAGGEGGDVRVDGVLMVDLPHYGAREFEVATRDVDLAHWLTGAPPSRLGFTVRGALTGDSGVAPSGAVTATLGGPDPPIRPLAGSARLVATLGGSLDSLGVEVRASVERVAWRGWQVPAGRARLQWRPGPTPAFALEATLDSLAYGTLGFSG